MSRIAKGTVFTLNANYANADLAMRRVQNFSQANPTTSPANGAPEFCSAADRAWRETFGSKLTMVVCACGQVNPSVRNDLRTVCCSASTVTVVS
jgi:hypothetical protein